MKRIYNDIPVRSVLYLFGALQKIKIVDYVFENNYYNRGFRKINDYKPKVMYEGTVADCNYMVNDIYRIEKSKIYGMDYVDDVIIISICMTSDEY